METNVMDRVKTFEDALNELGTDHPLVKEYFHASAVSSNTLSYIVLCIITAALNEGWKPTFTEDEYRYHPCFYFYTEREIDNMGKDERAKVFMLDKPIGKYTGLVYAGSSDMPSGAYNYVSSRLCFKTRELAKYAGKQFIGYYVYYYME